MPVGILNPSDNARATGTRPVSVPSAAAARRWFSDDLHTVATDDDLNGILAQFRAAADYYSIPDVEGDDLTLQKTIAAAAMALTGNLAALQGLVGSSNTAPYFTGTALMGLYGLSSYSRSLLGLSTLTAWQDQLGISAAASANVIALGALTGGPNQLPYFTGVGTMAQTPFTSAARALLDDADAPAMRTTLGLLSGATADIALYAPLASPAFTGTPTAPTQTAGNNTTRLATTAFVTSALAALPAYQPLDGELTALAGLASAADRLPYFTGAGAAALTTFSAFMRTLLDDADAPAARATLLLGTMAVANTADYVPKAGGAYTGFVTLHADPASALGAATKQYVDVNYMPKIGGTFTGVVSGLTATPGDTTTKFATTAFVQEALATGGGAFQPLDAELTALAGLTSAADQLPYFTGAGAAALAALTPFARTLLDDTSNSVARTTLGLGTAAVKDTGSSGDAVPLLNASTNTWSGSIVANGNITIDRTAAVNPALLILNSQVGEGDAIRMLTAGLFRWIINKEGTLEGGGNAGSNFNITAYDDLGNSIGAALTITRSTRIASFAVSPTAPTPTAGDNTLKLATTAFVAALGATKQPLDAELTALAGLASAADQMPYFTGVGAAALTPLTVFARSLLDDASNTAARTTLGLGTAAVKNTGNNGDAVPLLNAIRNTFLEK